MLLLCGAHSHLVRHLLGHALAYGRAAVVRVVAEVGERAVVHLTQRACHVLVTLPVLGLVQDAQHFPHEPLLLYCLAEGELPLRKLQRHGAQLCDQLMPQIHPHEPIELDCS